MENSGTYIKRKQATPGTTGTGHAAGANFFHPPSSYPPQPYNVAQYNLRQGIQPPVHNPALGPSRTNPRGFLPPTAPAVPQSRGGATNPAQFQGPLDQQRLAAYYASMDPAYGGNATGAAAPKSARPYRLPPDALMRSRGVAAAASNKYPSPPNTAPQGGRQQLIAMPHGSSYPMQQQHPSSAYPQHAPLPTAAATNAYPSAAPAALANPHHSDEGARARAALIDRERRQIFSFLSSPNCFLFSAVNGPVGLTEEDLDLLLAAGQTSTWTLLHLRSLDKQGKRFRGFEQLIPAVATRANKQMEENRKVLAWLTGAQCALFSTAARSAPEGANDPNPASAGVLLSMADVERLVIESQSGLDTLKQLQAIQNSGEQFENLQQLINALREVEIAKSSNATGASVAAARADKNQAASKAKGATDGSGNASSSSSAPAAAPTAPFADVDSEERRMVLDYCSSSECSLFSNADAVVATATELDALIQWCGNAALAIETLMQLDQNHIKFTQFHDILPTLRNIKEQGKGLQNPSHKNAVPASSSAAGGDKTTNAGALSLRPLLTQSEIEANRAMAHRYLSSSDCLLFSEMEQAIQATGKDFDELIFAAGGDAERCVQIMKELDAGFSPEENAAAQQQQGPDGTSQALVPLGPDGLPLKSRKGMKFHSFHQLIEAVSVAHAAQLAAEEAKKAADQWTPALREEVLQWLASPACNLFDANAPNQGASASDSSNPLMSNSSNSNGDVEVHVRELDQLMDLGGSHTLTWLLYFSTSIPVVKFNSFSQLCLKLKQSVAELKNNTIPRLVKMLSAPNCALFAAPGNQNALSLKSNAKKPSSRARRHNKNNPSSPSSALSSGPSSGAAIAARVDTLAVEELVYTSIACLDTPIHCEMLVREGRCFTSFPALVAAVKEAHEDRRNLAFVSDADRAAIVDFLSKESCVLFAEGPSDPLTNPSGQPTPAAQFASAHPGVPLLLEEGAQAARERDLAIAAQQQQTNQDIHVRKSDLDRLIVEGKGVNMTLFHLSMINASGKQFQQFIDLIPAVRLAHQQSQQEKQELWVKLQTHRATLFPPSQNGATLSALSQAQQQAAMYGVMPPSSRDPNLESPVPFVTQSQSDQLYIDGTAGGQTIHYIDVILDTGAEFSSLQELTAMIKELHGMVLRNRYASYLMERSERTLTAQERRNVLLSYLYSHECTLFSEAEDVNVSDEDLDALQAEAGGNTLGSPIAPSNTPLAHTLLFLRYIDWSGRKFQAFAALKASVRDCYLASIRQKKAILDYLRSGVNEANAAVGSGAAAVAAMHHSSQGCKLFSQSAPQLQRTLDIRDIDRLFVQGTAGPMTMSYLLDLADANLSFTSLDALIHAIRLAHEQAMETRAVEKRILLSYLGSGSCTLLNPSPQAAAQQHGGHHTGAAVAAAAAASQVKSVSDMELVTLLNVGKGGVSTLFFLQLLEASNKAFNSVAELFTALRDIKEGYTQVRKKELAVFLKHERCHLLRDLERTPINQACVDRLFVESGAGSSTLLHLWILNAQGHSFATLESLLQSVRLSYEASFTRAGSERMMLLVHLFGPRSGGIFKALQNSTSGQLTSASAGLQPLFWLKLNMDDVDTMISLCENGANALRFLLQLARANRSFESFPALLDALALCMDELQVGRRKLLAKLTDTENSHLFETATKGVNSIDVNALTLQDMDALVLRTQDARKTLFLLDAFESRGAKFASFSDLIAAIHMAHLNTMASIRTEKSLIYLHLTSPACMLLPAASQPNSLNGQPALQILDSELDQLFLIAGSAKGTLFYLNQLESHHKNYESMTDLIHDVTTLHAEAQQIKKEVFEFFKYPTTKLLQPQGHTAQATISMNDVDRLYTESQAGVDLMPLLLSLESSGNRFLSLTQIISAIRNIVQRKHQQTKEDRLLILNYLSRADCRLFRGPVAAKPKDIDALIAAGGGTSSTNPAAVALLANTPSAAAITLELLKEFELQTVANATPENPAGVPSFAALIEATATLRATQLAQRQAVLQFLTGPRCFLFKDAPQEVRIDLAAVDNLFVRSGAGSKTFDHIRALAVAGGRFGSFFTFDELIEAVASLHAQAERDRLEEIARQTKPKEDMEESKEQDVQQPSAKGVNTVQLALQQQRVAQAIPNAPSAQAALLALQPNATDAVITPSIVLDFLTHEHRRFFVRAPEAVLIGEQEVQALLSVAESPASLLRHLIELERGASGHFQSFAEMQAVVQSLEHRSLSDKKSLQAFLASHKCRLLRPRKDEEESKSMTAPSPSEPVAARAYKDAQVENLILRGGAGCFTLNIVQRLNDDLSVHAENFEDLILLVSRAHRAQLDTLRSQKQMIRTYLASFHSSLLWCTPHGSTGASPVNIQSFRHRLSDADLDRLLLEAGGSASALLRHLQKLDETRLHAAAAALLAPGAASSTAAAKKSYQSMMDLVHAVRDQNHHELHSKRELLEQLNAPSCPLWESSSTPASHQAPPKASVHDVDRLFDATHAHFDTPLFLWLFAHAGRKFHTASELVDAVREMRTTCSAGSNAEALVLVAHFMSSLCELLPKPSPAPGVTVAPFRATLADIVQLLHIGGGGSATLFELLELESAGFQARDFQELVRKVAVRSNGDSMKYREELLSYVTEGSSIFAQDAKRIEELFGANSGYPATTDSLAQLPATSYGVSRLLEESGCGFTTLEFLRSLDRNRLSLPDLRSAIDELLDAHANAPRRQAQIQSKSQKLASDKGVKHPSQKVGAAIANAQGHVSVWSAGDRQRVLDFLSDPATLLFSESAASLEVSAGVIDELLEATADVNDIAVGLEHDALEALVLLRGLNHEARKLSDLNELLAVLRKEHMALRNLAQHVRARLVSADCGLWNDGHRPIHETLTEKVVLRHLILESDAGLQIMQRLDELEVCETQFSTLDQLASGVAQFQQAFNGRVSEGRTQLLAHLSRPEISGLLFSRPVSMSDVDLFALLTAARFGSTNASQTIDPVRHSHEHGGKLVGKYESVEQMLSSVRAATAQNEQDLLDFLASPAGQGLLQHPHHVLTFTRKHAVTVLPFIYGSVDAGSRIVARAQKLAEKGVAYPNLGALVHALRLLADTKSRPVSRPVSASNSRRGTMRHSLMPSEEDVQALVAFLQSSTTLLFQAEAAEDLRIETDAIHRLFQASVPADSNDVGSWQSCEPHLRALNAVHRRFAKFEQLEEAVRFALRPEQKGSYCGDEQIQAIRDLMNAPDHILLFVPGQPSMSPPMSPVHGDSAAKEAGSLSYDSQSHVVLSRRQTDRLLKLMPVNPEAPLNGFELLLFHLKWFALVGRQFKDWSQLHAALTYVIQFPDMGHLSEGERRALQTFFASPEMALLDRTAVPDSSPTPAEIDALVSAAGGGMEQTMEFLSSANERKPRFISMSLLIEEITILRRNTPVKALSSPVGGLPSPTPSQGHGRPSFSRPPSVPLIPHISGEDQQKIATFLSSSQLFANATGQLEISVETLDALAFECGSVPDLLFLLKRLDKAGARFAAFNELHLRVKEEMSKAEASGPVGEEPKPTDRKVSTPRHEPRTPLSRPPTSPSLNQLESVVPVLAPAPLKAQPAIPVETAPASAAVPATEVAPVAATPAPAETAPTAAAVPALSEEDRTEFITWLQSPACNFFGSSENLSVTTEELDAIVHQGGGIKQTLVLLTHLSNNGAKFQAFNEILPALKAEMANPTPAKPAEQPAAAAAAPATEAAPVTAAPALVAEPVPVAAEPAPAVAAAAPAPASGIVPLSEAERGQLVEVLTNLALFSEATEDLTIEPEELDEMRHDAGSLDTLLASLKELDARGGRPKNFKTLFNIMKEYAKTKVFTFEPKSEPSTASSAAAPAAASAAAPAASSSAPAAATDAPTPAAPGPLVPMTDAERDQVVAVLSEGGLFSEATSDLEIEPADLDEMKHDARTVTALIDSLKELDANKSRPKNFKELFQTLKVYWTNKGYVLTNPAAPATAAAAAAPAPVTEASSAAPASSSTSDEDSLVSYVGSADCLLFSTTTQDLDVEPSQLAEILALAKGWNNLQPILKGMDHVHRRFQTFAELVSAVKEFIESHCHIGGQASDRIVELLSSEKCTLFQGATEELEVTVEELDALVAAGKGIDNTLAQLSKMNDAGQKFQKFTQLAPAVAAFIGTQAK